MNVKLVVVQGRSIGKEIPVRSPKFLIGRGIECHLRPNSDLVSRHHCMILIHDDEEVRLRDLGSTNGTLVNGIPIPNEVMLCAGDLIEVGPLVFQIEMDPIPIKARVGPPRTESEPEVGEGTRTVRQIETDIDELLTQDTQHELPAQGDPSPVVKSPDTTPEIAAASGTTFDGVPAEGSERVESSADNVAKPTRKKPRDVSQPIGEHRGQKHV